VPMYQLCLVVGSGSRVLVLLLERRGGIKHESVATSDVGMRIKLGGGGKLLGSRVLSSLQTSPSLTVVSL
jgi:hypothetical protein